MISFVKKTLKAPYYFNPSIKFKLKISSIYGFFVFLFLFLFKPFTLSTFSQFLLIYTLGIGLITFVMCFIGLTIPPLIFKGYFNEDNWTVGKNIGLSLFLLLLIGSACWYYGKIIKLDYEIEHISYGLFVYYTFLVGLFPVSFIIFLNERTVRERRESKAKGITALKMQKTIEVKTSKIPESITLTSENKKEELHLKIKDLVYITSQGNYASFFLLTSENQIKEVVLRITLNHITKQLQDFKNVIRCHKSYIVNTKYIEGISGNARGYVLHSNLIAESIPVSRKFSKEAILALID